MVSIASLLAASAVVLSSVANADDVNINSLSVGEFYRPEGDIVSAFPSATTPIRRSPCPALNTLANHGELPRHGMNVTKDIIRAAITSQFNLDIALVNAMLAPVPDTFDLNQISTHGLIEHDASIVHADLYFGYDPLRIDPDLVQDALSRGDGKVLTVQELGGLRRDRLATCRALNPTCTFATREATIAFGESALILDAFGGNKNSTITREHFVSFMVNERIPADYVKSPSVISLAQVQTTSGKIVAVASATQAL